jgi:hypothetical protein
MKRLTSFVKANRVPVAIAIALLVLAVLAFQIVMGLSPIFAVALFALFVGAALVVYRLWNRSKVAWDQPLAGGRLFVSALVGFVVVALAIQAVPLGWDRSNPPITAEPEWDSPRTRELAARACFDCHSNEVDYPWYSKLAPMSWALELHVDRGRGKVNYSEWDQPQDDAEESAETVREGEMPPSYYTLFTHSEARLTDAEKQELIDGFEATPGTSE